MNPRSGQEDKLRGRDDLSCQGLTRAVEMAEVRKGKVRRKGTEGHQETTERWGKRVQRLIVKNVFFCCVKCFFFLLCEEKQKGE